MQYQKTSLEEEVAQVYFAVSSMWILQKWGRIFGIAIWKQFESHLGRETKYVVIRFDSECTQQKEF